MTEAQALPPNLATDRGSLARAAIVLVPLLLFLGGLSARVSGSTEANGWYRSLILPVLQPPGPVFGIAWSILYVLIATAAALIWASKGARGRRTALALFLIGFAINLAWSPAFFRAHMIAVALGIIAVMFFVALATTMMFGRINRLAAWLMVPYLMWLCFAAGLNARILMLNPGADALQIGI